MTSTDYRSDAVQRIEDAQVMLLKAAYDLRCVCIDLREIGENDTDVYKAMGDMVRSAEFALDAKRKQLKKEAAK